MDTKHQSGLYNKLNFKVAEFASKEKGRYTVCGILVEPNATVATDGQRLVKVSCPNHEASLEDFPAIPGSQTVRATSSQLLPRQAAIDIAKNIPTKERIPALNNAAMMKVDDGYIGFVSTDLQTTKPTIVKSLDGQFPDYEPCFHAGEPVAQISLNGKYMKELCGFLASIDSGAHHCITLKFYGSKQSLQLEAKNDLTGQTASALLMPLNL